MKQISLLPEPKLNPRMPVNGTLAHQALLLLLEGRKVSHPVFEAYTGSWRLAAHIHLLKRLGWPIEKETGDFSEDDSNKQERHMGLYYLPDEVLSIVYNW